MDIFKVKAIISGILMAGFMAAFAGESCNYKSSGKEASLIKKHEIKTGKSYGKFHKDCPAISRADLVKLIESESVVIVDANKAETFNAGHIPGAISYKKSGENFVKLLPKNKNALIVAYCGGPGCQAWCKAADELQNLGYKNIKHYPGGIKEWRESGNQVNKI